MSTEKYQKWTEYNWEEELKREDEKINAYLDELPIYLDLPNEENMIFHKLNENHIALHDLPLWEDTDDEIGFSGDFSPLVNKEDSINSEFYYDMGNLTTAISIFVSTETDILNSISVNLLYLLGKLMSLQADIVQIPGSELPNLKIALQKRQISIINKVIGILNSFKLIKTVNTEKIEAHILNTHKLRNIIIDNRFNKTN